MNEHVPAWELNYRRVETSSRPFMKAAETRNLFRFQHSRKRKRNIAASGDDSDILVMYA
jgi:hypothetical protein